MDRLAIFLVFVTGLLLALPAGAGADASDLSDQNLVEIGRKVYQEGLLADGTPVKAFVLGDIEVSGSQFTCLNCHRRSGLGGPEGTKFVLPVNGGSILIPRVDLYMARPAYDAGSFAEALPDRSQSERRGIRPDHAEVSSP